MHIEECKKFFKVSIDANPKINIIALEGGFELGRACRCSSTSKICIIS